MLFDRDHFLLRDEPVPAAERLGVIGRIDVIGGHVFAHDVGGITGDIEAGLETVLQLHAGNGFRADRIPCSILGSDEFAHFADILLISHNGVLSEEIVSVLIMRLTTGVSEPVL
jgi:hypothetical protein